MADDDAAGEAAAQRGLGDQAQAVGGRIVCLVDMEIEIEAARLGVAEQAVEKILRVGLPIRHAAQQSATLGNQIGERGEPGMISRRLRMK